MAVPRIPDYEIDGSLEQWSNGYFVSHFETAGTRWKLMVSHKDTEPHSYLRHEPKMAQQCWGPEWRWLQAFYFPTFADALTVEQAVQIIHVLKQATDRGHGFGFSDAQLSIRNALGISK